MQCPIHFDEDGIVAFVKPVENFRNRLFNRSRRNKGLNIFSDLHKVLTWPRLLSYAALNVLSNQGAYTCGVDGISKGLFMRTFDHQIQTIRKMLKDGYRPSEVFRVYIPKANGDKRPLGIPILRDRVIQEAYRLILEPIFEAHFVPNSHGFRVGYSTQDSIKDCWSYMQPVKKFRYVLEFDIKKFFDNVDHNIMYKLLNSKIRDRKFKLGIWRMMRSPISEDGVISQCVKGVPQGGVISPLLANIYLHEFDKFILNKLTPQYSTKREIVRFRKGKMSTAVEQNRHKNGGSIGYVRYADDSVAFWNGHLKELYNIKEKCKVFLKDELQLELSEEKTKITDIEEGFKFVGFYLNKARTANSTLPGGEIKKFAVISAPRESVSKAMKNITAKCREATVKGYDPIYTIVQINSILVAFYSYFRMVTFRSILYNKMFYHATTQMYYYLKRRNIKHAERLLRHVMGWKTFTFGKKFIYPPRYANKFKQDTSKRFCKGLVCRDRTMSRFSDRQERDRVKRLYPNDPIAPINGSWRELRSKILERDKGKCVLCGKQAEEVDHIYTKSEAKCNRKIAKIRDKAPYLRSLCKSCHMKRHGKRWSWDKIMNYIEKVDQLQSVKSCAV